VTKEIVYVDLESGYYYYPNRTKVYDKTGKEVKDYEKKYGRYQSHILSIINRFVEVVILSRETNDIRLAQEDFLPFGHRETYVYL
jgi:hypothetical protein